jgi:hypothetical protein
VSASLVVFAPVDGPESWSVALHPGDGSKSWSVAFAQGECSESWVVELAADTKSAPPALDAEMLERATGHRQ